MDLRAVRKVGVIGAGVAGLSTAKTLLSQGLECTVFERGSVLGGVWSTGYLNFGVQVQRELYEFPDWPLPGDVPNFTPGPIIQRYLEDYAKHFGVWSRIIFETTVTGLREREDMKPGWTITHERNGFRDETEFDLVVVCIGLYSQQAHIPQAPGREEFAGEVIHASALKSVDQLNGKRVVVVGFGKSATDIALESASVASDTTIVFREPHWPVPQKLAGVLPFKWAMLNRLTSTLIPPYYHAANAEQVVHTLGKPLVWLWWRLVELLLVVQCRLWSRFGNRPSLVPAKPIEFDAFGESTMLPRPAFYRSVRDGAIEPQRSQIVRYADTGVMLENGVRVDADIVVFATGWKTDFGFLSEKTLSSIGLEDDGLYLYRQMLHPNVDHLVFIGNASTVLSILTYSLQARWLAELIKGSHRLPSNEHMRQDIEKMKAWKRRCMPFSQARGARLILHMQHYHDDLLTDLGQTPLRKTGFAAPFKEVFAPYEPSDYRDVIAD